MLTKKTLNILCTVGCVFATATALFVLSKMSVAGLYRSASAFFAIVAIILGLYYTISGYAKSDALEYKMFLVFYGLSELALIGGSSSALMPGVAAICRTAVYGGIIILSIAKDLGKKPSMFIAYVIVAFETLALLYFIISSPGILRDGELMNTIKIASSGALQFLSLLTLGFVIGKYKDKAARGSK